MKNTYHIDEIADGGNDFDNHIVCECRIKELNKWVMLDPTYNLYISDKDETPINISELRRKIAEQEVLVFSEPANYNGAAINKDEILTSYAEDLFWFVPSGIQGAHSENIKGIRMITIAPAGLDAKKTHACQYRFPHQKQGRQPGDEKLEKKRTGTGNIIYKGIDLLE